MRASILMLSAALLITAGFGCPKNVKLRPVDPQPISVRPVDVPSATLTEAVAELRGATTADDAARGLDDVAQQDDPYGEAIAAALCAGMEKLAEAEDEEATADNWRDFLIESVVEVLGEALRPEIVERIDGVLTTWDLAQLNVRAAQVYYDACVRRA
jgi:hypothetical protein